MKESRSILTLISVILTRSLLFLFELLLQFMIFRLRVKVVVAVLGELPLVGFVHQIRRAAREVDTELLNVDFHDAAVDCHAHLRKESQRSALGTLSQSPAVSEQNRAASHLDSLLRMLDHFVT